MAGHCKTQFLKVNLLIGGHHACIMLHGNQINDYRHNVEEEKCFFFWLGDGGWSSQAQGFGFEGW